MQLGAKRPRWFKWAVRTSLLVLFLVIWTHYLPPSNPLFWRRDDDGTLSAISLAVPSIISLNSTTNNATWAFVLARQLAGTNFVDIYSFAAGKHVCVIATACQRALCFEGSAG